jgi:hypothetical protein
MLRSGRTAFRARPVARGSPAGPAGRKRGRQAGPIAAGRGHRGVSPDGRRGRPSIHSTQPWRFALDPVSGSGSRSARTGGGTLPGTGPGLRAQYLSVGAAVLDLQVAAARPGLLPGVRLPPVSASSPVSGCRLFWSPPRCPAAVRLGRPRRAGRRSGSPAPGPAPRCPCPTCTRRSSGGTPAGCRSPDGRSRTPSWRTCPARPAPRAPASTCPASRPPGACRGSPGRRRRAPPATRPARPRTAGGSPLPERTPRTASP